MSKLGVANKRASAAAPGREPPLHDEIYRKLQRALLVGELKPGEDVTIRSLAGSFGTSAMPVRDAIGRLVATKALEFGSNRTVSVPVMTRARYQEVLQLRLSLESLATERAVPHFDGKRLAKLERLHAEMEAAADNDPRAFFDRNQMFHFAIYEAGSSGLLMSFIEILWMHSGPFLGLIFGSIGVQVGQDNHAEILRAIRRGDASAAAVAVHKDLADAADIILSQDVFTES